MSGKMWNTIANFKENLSLIASEVLDTAEELDENNALGMDDDHLQSSSSATHEFKSQGRKGYENHSRSSGYSHRKFSNSNGLMSSSDFELLKELQLKCQQLEMREKDFQTQIGEKEKAQIVLNDRYSKSMNEMENLKQTMMQLQSELSSTKSQLQVERENSQKANQQCNKLEEESQEISATVRELQKRDVAVLNNSEVKNHQDDEILYEEIRIRDKRISEMQESISALEKERDKYQAEMEFLRNSIQTKSHENSSEAAKSEEVDILSEKLRSAEEALEKERFESRKILESVSLERDKAISNLSRLKQHLLEKESEDSEKMDRDSEEIATLEARIVQLEEALSQAFVAQSEMSKRSSDELQRSNLQIESLQQNIDTCLSALESKNVEIANLQSALGQYYAEIDTKDRYHVELLSAREEINKLHEELQTSKRAVDLKTSQEQEISEKLAAAEKKRLEYEQKMQKMEEDMLRLRHALEQSMIRLNRMSTDSDYYVDRRIVIKLLVTYFERNESEEVLELMGRMLGFGEEEKKRVCVSHRNANKGGVVRSVLGLPVRVVGGFLSSPKHSSSSPSSFSSSSSSSSSQQSSFADLWIDFLLKESEERDRKEKEKAAAAAAAAAPAFAASAASAAASAAAATCGAGDERQQGNVLVKGENGSDDVFGGDYFSSVPLNATEVASHRRVYSLDI